MKNQDVFVVSAVRTAIGSFGGSLKEIPLSHLATTAVKAALERSGVDPESVGHVVMGNVIPTEPRDAYLSRVAAVEAGIPHQTPACRPPWPAWFSDSTLRDSRASAKPAGRPLPCTARYTDPQLWQREQATLFAHWPVVAAHSSELPWAPPCRSMRSACPSC